jgi:hypothetical protein
MKLNGNTNTTTSRAVTVSACANFILNGLTVGKNGTLNDCHPYTSLVVVSGSGSSNVRIRNIGTAASPLNVGSNPTFYTGSIIDYGTGGGNLIKLQRCYMQNARTGLFTGGTVGPYNSTIFENCGGGSYNFSSNLPVGTNSIIRGSITATTNTPTSQGMNFRDYMSPTADTGTVFVDATSITAASEPYTELSVAGQGGLNSSTAVLVTSGDYYILETPYFIKGHGSFQNVAPTITATGSYTYEYQIDTGTGWNGSWRTLNATNLSGETFTASTGFKLKVKITATATSTNNSFTRISIATNSNSTNRTTLYDLDTSTLSFTGLQPGTEVRAYTGTDPATAVEIGAVESTAGSTFSFSHSAAGETGYIQIFALGYQPITIPYTYSANDESLLIQQVIDRNYVNPV